MESFTIISVPEYAEFHKYWVVEVHEENPKTLVYKTSYLTEDEAVNFLNNSNGHNLKLIKNEGWEYSRVLIDG